MADITTTPATDHTEVVKREETRGGVYFTPRVDILETDQELLLYADLPGVRPEDVDLNYEKGELVLHGRVRPANGREQWLLQEYDNGDFYRVFRIHESIDPGKIAAECKNGVLTVHLPKAEAARPRQIAVKAK
jgi:HSP20 family molecular chaperone IbpA